MAAPRGISGAARRKRGLKRGYNTLAARKSTTKKTAKSAKSAPRGGQGGLGCGFDHMLSPLQFAAAMLREAYAFIVPAISPIFNHREWKIGEPLQKNATNRLEIAVEGRRRFWYNEARDKRQGGTIMISQKERALLRELARQQMEYANQIGRAHV